MTSRQSVYALLFVLMLLVAACGSQEATPEATLERAAPTTESMKEPTNAVTAAKGAGSADAKTTKPMTDTMDQDQGDTMATIPMTDTMAMDQDHGDAMATDPMTDTVAMDQDPVAAIDLPAWFSAKLTDVNSGEAFTIADHQGKVVLVETLAVWCSNCLKQQKQVLALHEALGERDDFISVGLDIDLDESPDQLKGHAERNSFDWVYAVATAEVAREIGKLYGNQFLNPPATPMLIVDRQGEAHPLPFGIKTAEELQAALEPFLSEAM